MKTDIQTTKHNRKQLLTHHILQGYITGVSLTVILSCNSTDILNKMYFDHFIEWEVMSETVTFLGN